jgi:hypothetical protein
MTILRKLIKTNNSEPSNHWIEEESFVNINLLYEQELKKNIEDTINDIIDNIEENIHNISVLYSKNADVSSLLEDINNKSRKINKIIREYLQTHITTKQFMRFQMVLFRIIKMYDYIEDDMKKSNKRDIKVKKFIEF